MTGEQLTYISNLAYLSLQPHQEQERADYTLECLSGFFWWWPEAWREDDDWRSYQDRVLAKAKGMKDLMEYEALDRAKVVPPMPWRVWITFSPVYIAALEKKIRKADSNLGLRWWDTVCTDPGLSDAHTYIHQVLFLGQPAK
jgi:hypothetical protein